MHSSQLYMCLQRCGNPLFLLAVYKGGAYNHISLSRKKECNIFFTGDMNDISCQINHWLRLMKTYTKKRDKILVYSCTPNLRFVGSLKANESWVLGDRRPLNFKHSEWATYASLYLHKSTSSASPNQGKWHPQATKPPSSARSQVQSRCGTHQLRQAHKQKWIGLLPEGCWCQR